MTNEIVAIKKIKCNNEAEGLPSTTIREVSTVKALTHPNIVRFIK